MTKHSAAGVRPRKLINARLTKQIPWTQPGKRGAGFTKNSSNIQIIKRKSNPCLIRSSNWRDSCDHLVIVRRPLGFEAFDDTSALALLVESAFVFTERLNCGVTFQSRLLDATVTHLEEYQCSE